MMMKPMPMKTRLFRRDNPLLVVARLGVAVFAGMLFSWLVSGIADAGGMIQEDAKQQESTHTENDTHNETDTGNESHPEDQKHSDDHGHADLTNEEYFLGKDHLIAHTQDQLFFEIPSLKLRHDDHAGRRIWIPQISPWTEENPLMKGPEGKAADFIGNITFQPTKFIVLQLLAGLMIGVTFVWLGKKIQTGEPPKGKVWNLLEAVVVYMRDDVAKAAIGSQDYKRFVPLIWTIFFFVLTMNLMGMFPLLGTPTGNISVTSALALSVFAIVLFNGMKRLGVIGFWKAQVPHMDLPGLMKIPMTAGIWCIEVFGLFIKHLVLAVRLFANMFAGHMVLAVLVGFIGATWGTSLGWVVTPAAIGGSVALNLLELLVAFIQAYVFAFLSALFIGAAIHPH